MEEAIEESEEAVVVEAEPVTQEITKPVESKQNSATKKQTELKFAPKQASQVEEKSETEEEEEDDENLELLDMLVDGVEAENAKENHKDLIKEKNAMMDLKLAKIKMEKKNA
jgi:hypothetical protein